MMALKKIGLVLPFLLAVVLIFDLSGVWSVGRERDIDINVGPDGGDLVSTPEHQEESPVAGSGNLLVNPDFSAEFSGWQSVNGYWLMHPTSCDASIWPQQMAEMDQDLVGSDNPIGWEVGQEDWLWQDVAAPGAHDRLTLTIYESHHMRQGIAETRLYGSDDGVNWTEIWYRPQPEESAYGAGKGCEVVPGFSYEIPVSDSYDYYRLEFHGKMVVKNDGWIFSWVSLQVGADGMVSGSSGPELTPAPAVDLDSSPDDSNWTTPTPTRKARGG